MAHDAGVVSKKSLVNGRSLMSLRRANEELNPGLGRESAGEPVQIATETGDLTTESLR